jgi:hypothetical protein
MAEEAIKELGLQRNIVMGRSRAELNAHLKMLGRQPRRAAL